MSFLFLNNLASKERKFPHYWDLDAPVTANPVIFSKWANNIIWPVILPVQGTSEQCRMHIFKQSEGGTLLTLLQQCCARFVSDQCRTAQLCSWDPASLTEGRQMPSAVAMSNEKQHSALKGEREASGYVIDLLAPGRHSLEAHKTHNMLTCNFNT